MDKQRSRDKSERKQKHKRERSREGASENKTLGLTIVATVIIMIAIISCLFMGYVLTSATFGGAAYFGEQNIAWAIAEVIVALVGATGLSIIGYQYLKSMASRVV